MSAIELRGVTKGYPPREPGLPAQELLTGAAFRWRTGRNYVRLGPGQSHIVRIA